MNFVSYSYLVLFGLVLASRLTIGRRKTEPAFVVLLILVSGLFYAWHVPRFLLILLSSAAVDYIVGRYLGRPASADGQGPRYRRPVVLLSLAANLGLLFYFKYADFALDGVNGLAHALGLGTTVPRLDLTLPMGISFYTFASLSYTIDVYRREIRPVKGFGKFFLFI